MNNRLPALMTLSYTLPLLLWFFGNAITATEADGIRSLAEISFRVIMLAQLFTLSLLSPYLALHHDHQVGTFTSLALLMLLPYPFVFMCWLTGAINTPMQVALPISLFLFFSLIAATLHSIQKFWQPATEVCHILRGGLQCSLMILSLLAWGYIFG